MNQIIAQIFNSPQNEWRDRKWWGGKKIARERLTKCCNLLMRQVSLDNKFNFLYTSVYHNGERVSLKWRAEERDDVCHLEEISRDFPTVAIINYAIKRGSSTIL